MWPVGGTVARFVGKSVDPDPSQEALHLLTMQICLSLCIHIYYVYIILDKLTNYYD